jgi:DDE superfamily endonuclease
VARQYSGTLGKVGNCQIAVSVHAATDAASAVLDWRLFVPESWDETCVPDEAGNVANGHARRLRRQVRKEAGQVSAVARLDPQAVTATPDDRPETV